jgi:hypothetical protein
MRFRHTNGDDKDGCVPCYFEAVESLLNNEEPAPGCFTPSDDGEGFCPICGHATERLEPVAAQRECE